MIALDGTSRQLAAGLYGLAVSTYGDTVHVAGIRKTGTGIGTWVVIRVHAGSEPQEIVVAANAYLSLAPVKVITTAEGGVLVQFDRGVVAVGSRSTVAIALNLEEMWGGPRGSDTVVFAHRSNTLSRAMYAYDEPNGVPRITQLAEEDPLFVGQLLDPLPPAAPSRWFEFSTPAACQIGRIVQTPAGPTVEAFQCNNDNYPDIGSQLRVGIWGVDSDGALIAINARSQVISLSDAGATEVARGKNFRVIQDVGATPPRVMGWIGEDALGGFMCLAKHPERCWSTPPPVRIFETFADVILGSVLTMFLEGDLSHVVVTFVRPIGDGDRPQPK